MKTRITLLLLLGVFTGRELQAQEADITGTWTMYEMAWTTGDQVEKTTEEQLKDQGMMSEYSFMADGNFKLISNMTGSGKTENMEGTWKLEGDKLTITFTMEGNSRDIVWDFEFLDDAFNVKRTSPDGSTSVVNSFKRK